MNVKAETWTLAACIALLPPIWAVAAPYVGVSTGAVALICAGLCAANGDRAADAPRISAGFLMGDVWAVLAILAMDAMPWNPDAELFCTLFVLGGAAVVLSSLAPRVFFCPAWLCGWAIGLTIMTPGGAAGMGTMPIQIGVAMLVGVWYVGVALNIVRDRLLGAVARRRSGGKEQDNGN